MPFARAAEHFVILHVVTGANTSITEDAGLMIDIDHLRAVINATG